MSDPVARYFDRHAEAFNRRHDRERLQRWLRPGVVRGADRAVALVQELGRPRVLDVGCGPGRVAERLIEAGACKYVGIDVSRRMLELAGRRLEPHAANVTLAEGRLEEVELEERFDAVIALGLFDYVRDAAACMRTMAGLCTGVLLATFPRRHPLKDPVRSYLYGRYGCTLEHYDEARLEGVLAAAGLCAADVQPGRTGYCVRWAAASREDARRDESPRRLVTDAFDCDYEDGE